MQIIAACLLLLMTVPFAQAGNIYVASDNGSDISGTGGFGSPYATVQKGADVARPGDTVYVRGGRYNEGVVLKTSGEAGNRIVFSAFPGEIPVLDGSVPLVGWTRCASAADCGNNPDWEYIWYVPLPDDVDAAGVGLYEAGGSLKQAMFPNQPDPFYNDQVAYFKPVPVDGYSETTIVDSEVFTQPDSGYWTGTKIWIWGGNNTVIEEIVIGYDPAEHEITFTRMDFAPMMQDDRYAMVNHIAILDTAGEYVVDTAARRIYLWPRYTDDPNDGSIYRGMHVNGFKISSKNYVTIQGFDICNYEDYSLAYTRDGIGINNYGTSTSLGLELRDNRIFSIQGNGINLGGCRHCIIERNYVGSTHGKGIFNNCADSTVVRDNEIYQTASTAIGFYRSDDCIIWNNHIHDCNGHHGNGLTFYLGCHNMLVFGNRVIRGNIALTTQQSEGIYVINNILYNPDVENSHKYAIAIWGGKPDDDYPADATIDSLVFIHNMLYGSVVISDSIGNAVIRNNIVGGYYANEFGGRTRDYGYNVVFEPVYNQAYGEGDIEQTDVNTIFANFKNGDFNIIATSPAVDAAPDVSAFWPTGVFPQFDFSHDIDGTVRPQEGVWDIGPFEYVAGGQRYEMRTVSNALHIANPVSAAVLNSLEGVTVIDMAGNDVTGGITPEPGIVMVRTDDGCCMLLLVTE